MRWPLITFFQCILLFFVDNAMQRILTIINKNNSVFVIFTMSLILNNWAVMS